MIEKMNPFKQIVEAMKAFTDTDIFYQLRKQSTGSKIVVALLTGILACLFTFILGGMKLAQDNVWKEMFGALPEFAYYNGQMVCEEKYDQPIADVSDVYVVVDTDVDAWVLPQYSNSTQGVDITNKVASITSNPEVDQILFISGYNLVLIRGIRVKATYQEMKWSELFGMFGIQSLSKSQILSGYKGVIMKFATLLFFLGIPVYIIRLFSITLLLTIVALIIKAVQKADEDFTTLYWISFYIESVFIMIISLFKVFLTWSSSVMTIACLLYYITVMIRVLKNGAPMEGAFAGNSGAASNIGVVNDDFEQFMEETTYVRDVGEKSDFDLYANPQENSVPNTGRSPFDLEAEPGKEQTGQTSSFSGLSLKQDD